MQSTMKKILIVEDEQLLADMYKTKFEMEGLSADVVFSAEEAVSYLGKNLPDLILLDILLPRDSGIDFLKKVEGMKGVSQIPIVVFSNYADPKTKKEALKLGARAYLIKTQFTPKEISSKIKKYLKK